MHLQQHIAAGGAASPARSEQLPDATVAAAIARRAASHPERPAVVMPGGGLLTYCAFAEQLAAFGASLQSHDVGSTARVAIMLREGVELAVALVATACHATVVPLNPKLTATELDDLFARLPVDVLVVSDEIDSVARDVAVRRGVRVLEATYDKSDGFKISGAMSAMATRASVAPNGQIHADHPAVILQTSATTGHPKLVPLTHRNLVSTAEKRRLLFAFTPDDRGLCATPLYYSQALKGALFTSLLVGGSVACPERADGDVLRWLTELRPTWFAAGPAFFMNLLERALERQGEALHHHLRFMRSDGAPLPAAVRHKIEEAFGVPVLEGYGLTETGTVAVNSLAPEQRKPGTLGRPSPDEVAIRAEDGRLLPPGEAGEIVVRGPAVTPGYLYDEDANRAAFSDGWFLTGDLGSIDADGHLTYLGRRKEFISRGGEKVTLYEVERALLLHPSVRDAAVFSIPHPRLSEDVAAAVVLMPGATVTPSELKAFLADRLTPFKIPQQVVVLPSLPKGANGKTSKVDLAQLVANRVRDVVPPGTPLHSQILEIWQRLLGRTDIGIDDDFFEAGGDSLLAVQMVCEVEAITRRRIPPAALRSVYTIGELVTAVVRGMPASDEMVTRAREGGGTPFLFCHGDYSTRGFYALRLADMIDADQPVDLLHPDIEPDSTVTIEDMAQAYVPRILAAYPTGALRLGGYCNGGLLAWEIARRLDRMGREVEAVVLLETISLNARPGLRAVARLIDAMSVVPGLGGRLKRSGMQVVWRTGRRLRTLWRTGQWQIGAAGPYSRVMANYVPPKLTARVLCIVCDKNRNTTAYATAPWFRLAGDVHCEYVAGTHFSCITKHVGEIAGAMNEFFRSRGPDSPCGETPRDNQAPRP